MLGLWLNPHIRLLSCLHIVEGLIVVPEIGALEIRKIHFEVLVLHYPKMNGNYNF